MKNKLFPELISLAIISYLIYTVARSYNSGQELNTVDIIALCLVIVGLVSSILRLISQTKK
jgi:hypothetical protein